MMNQLKVSHGGDEPLIDALLIELYSKIARSKTGCTSGLHREMFSLSQHKQKPAHVLVPKAITGKGKKIPKGFLIHIPAYPSLTHTAMNHENQLYYMIE